jgi:hypothetical protein
MPPEVFLCIVVHPLLYFNLLGQTYRATCALTIR